MTCSMKDKYLCACDLVSISLNDDYFDFFINIINHLKLDKEGTISYALAMSHVTSELLYYYETWDYDDNKDYIDLLRDIFIHDLIRLEGDELNIVLNKIECLPNNLKILAIIDSAHRFFYYSAFVDNKLNIDDINDDSLIRTYGDFILLESLDIKYDEYLSMLSDDNIEIINN